MSSNFSVAFNLLPGMGYIHRGQYMRGVIDLICFVALLFTGWALLSTGNIILALLVMASSAYRMAYMVRVSVPLVQQPSRIDDHKILEPQSMIAVLKPRWWIGVLNWPWLYIALVTLVVVYLSRVTEMSWMQILKGASGALDLAKGFLAPDWTQLPDALKYAAQTIAIAILGTLGGILIAVPVSLLCAKNLMQATLLTGSLYYVARWVMAVVRATPTFLLGLIFVAWVGLGPFPGVLAITVFSGALMTKLLSESIESINPGPVEAATATGANLFHVILFSVFPQMSTVFIAISLYCLEINIHSATVLGLIGAQGIGMPIYEYLSSLAYGSAAVYILVVIVITVGADYASGFVRSRIK
ncbi:phosphonate ABC transporter, permease protein PhnE [Marinobacter sp. LM1]|jgi:phosphonate transport system permease protein|uniref:phosphonate ABC transporter, permease protein PhnE n=1 Tax=Marinobacter sp. LM1 TaxID=3003349 RepID=UPI0036D416C4|tara:strand:+ start:359 stop:1429 length:1071 start_codon:yes stop_codon:yes gene_type:complete